MEIVLLVGARANALPEQSALEMRDRIREHASDDRMLGYLADAITEDLALRPRSKVKGANQAIPRAR